MREDLDRALCTASPYLYGRRELFGFECGDGWFDLLAALSNQLEPLVMEHIFSIDEAPPVAVQVKEKLAGLRFYMSYYPAGAEALIRLAEVKSFMTCEDCGFPGKRRELLMRGRNRGTGRLMTLCDPCLELNESRLPR